MDAFVWLWNYLKKYVALMWLGAAFITVSTVLGLIGPYVIGLIVDEVIKDGKIELLMYYIWISVAAVCARFIIRYAFQYIFEFCSQNIIKNIRCSLYKRLQGLDFNFFDINKTGDIMSRMTGDLDAVRHSIAGVFPGMFDNFAVFVFGVLMMLTISPGLALWLLTITPFVFIIGFDLAKKVRPSFFNIREQFSKLNSTVQENISGNRVIKAYTRENYEIEKFERDNEGFRQANLKSARIWESYLPTLDTLAGVLNVILLVVGGIYAVKQKITIGQFVTFNSILWCIYNPMRMVGWYVNDMQRFIASTVKIRQLQQTEPKIRNKVETVDKDRLKGKVEFKNVIFSYDKERVLKYINFSAEPGSTIAIIGPTGSGKSSLTNLISRFYECSYGAVYIDDINIKNIDILKLRKNISVAMQDVFLFSDTIEGNIAYGAPNASFDDVVRVAKAADAHEFIKKMPEGYDTIIGERGVGLSGGQKQRIALARALLKNPSILILDDTTSSVDMETEHLIQMTLKNYYRDQTTFVIAHRISTVKNADLILVLSKGKVVEWGTHDQLVNKKGYYHEVYVNQFGDFNNAPVYDGEDYPAPEYYSFESGEAR